MDHTAYMQEALLLASHGRGLVSPNPLVGSVVVADDQIRGRGWHEGPGTAHAEVMALADAGDAARGATLYVTLEPCDHTGRTGPCTEAIIAAGITKVVAAIEDPNPSVAGGGVARLRAAGIEVVVGPGSEEATDINAAFLHATTTGLPLVTLKLAATLDGKIASADRSRRWISSEGSRDDVQRIRASVGAIVVGSGTALADDPHLTVRDPAFTGRPPLRVVLDGRGRVPAQGHLFDRAAPTLMVTTDVTPASTRRDWEAGGAQVLELPAGIHGGVSLEALIKELGAREIDGVLLEGGGIVAGAALAAGVVDRVILYLAPILAGSDGGTAMLGGGDGAVALGGPRQLSIKRVTQIGPDVKVEADVHRDR